jgi:hypothetical protein
MPSLVHRARSLDCVRRSLSRRRTAASRSVSCRGTLTAVIAQRPKLNRAYQKRSTHEYGPTRWASWFFRHDGIRRLQQLETGRTTGVDESYDDDADPVALGLIDPDDMEPVPSEEADLRLRAGSPSAEMMSIAIYEEGRWPDDVGKDLGRHPYDLGRYLDPGQAWCSEFVSWAYQAAGYPLTGGKEGGHIDGRV